ncbi:SusC/RagA family TonB-linked outer membrane protein [Pedobacter glucosidilyticus]|uniref:SusC/RagA family TonB-linked outer membrane protein n=1 Tax=Pedobacter glucosidilyticus TaxID=1122941 RepID=UPI00041B3613|nr:SusC/RagA family TonB-linked outer membrane protein [Pedobacter glucosidilyticus]
MTRIVTYLFFCLCLLAIAAGAQELRLSGRIIASPGNIPLANATVFLKRSGLSTSSRANGDFSISGIRLPDTLIVSYMGYQSHRQIITSANSGLQVLLLPAPTTLQEVVVNTGYQQLAAGRATGAYSLVDSALFHRQVGTDVFRRLEGITPSILFDKRGGDGAVTRFNVRGLSTITTGQQRPLIILDNFPYEGDVANINPNDVESMTILKDAAAAAIWGAKAGNGVVVITTKKAKLQQPLQVALNVNSTFSSLPDLKAYPVMSSKDFLETEKFLYDRGYYNAAIANVRNRPVLSPYVELLARKQAGNVNQQEIDALLEKWQHLDLRDEYLQHLYRRAVNQQYSLALSGGSRQLAYNGSIGFDRNLSQLEGDQNQRFTLNNQMLFSPTAKLKITAGMILTQNKSENNSLGAYNTLSPGGLKNFLYPYARFADDQGNALALPKNYRKAYTDTAGRGRLLNWDYRPLDELANNDNSRNSRDILLDVQASYRLLPFLKASLAYRYQNTLGQSINNYNTNSYFTRDLINRFTQLSATNTIYKLPYGGIRDLGNNSIINHGLRAQLDVNKQWANHSLDMLGGAELRQTTGEASQLRVYGFNDLNYISAPADLVTAFPIYGMLSSNTTIPRRESFQSTLDRFLSYYINATYRYTNRYTLSASARKDQSNLFGVNTNMRGVPLYSLGAAWHTDQETFFHSSWLSRLNFRFSYGYTGNVNTSLSALTTIRYNELFMDINTFTGLPSATVVNPPNPDLRWEKTGIFNAAADFGLSNNRLSGSINYFRKRSVDLIGLIDVDPTYGGTGQQSLNSAVLSNNGVELELNSVNLKGALGWNSTFLFSSSRNKVEAYYYEPANATGRVGNGSNISPMVGKPAYSVVSYKWAGLDAATGDPQVYLRGEVTKDYAKVINEAKEEDLIFHGPAIAPYFGALRNDFTYQNLSLSFNLTYRFGYVYRPNSIDYNALFSVWATNPDFAQRWQQPGDEQRTHVPAMVYPANSNRDLVYNNSSVLVEKGDHVRLQDIRLAYNFSAAQLTRLRINRLSLFCYASNLGILWKASHKPWDPDYGQTYVPPKNYAIGLTANF